MLVKTNFALIFSPGIAHQCVCNACAKNKLKNTYNFSFGHVLEVCGVLLVNQSVGQFLC